MIFLNENIDLATAFEMIQNYALKSVYPTVGAFSGSVDITKHPEDILYRLVFLIKFQVKS